MYAYNNNYILCVCTVPKNVCCIACNKLVNTSNSTEYIAYNLLHKLVSDLLKKACHTCAFKNICMQVYEIILACARPVAFFVYRYIYLC